MRCMPTDPGSMRERGFTLVEMLVVLIIIAILMAVATSAYLNHRLQARVTRAKAHALFAQGALESCAAGDLERGYARCDAAAIRDVEPSIPGIVDDVGGRSSSEDFFLTASNCESGEICISNLTTDGYQISSRTEGAKGTPYVIFTIRKSRDGAVARSCKPRSASMGCVKGRW